MDLLALEGIAAADIDGEDNTPAGVRVRLAPGADAKEVGPEVQRVLAEHGMRSHMTESSTARTDDAASAGTEHAASAGAVGRGRPSSRQAEAPPPPPGALRAAVGADVVQLRGIVVDPAPTAVTETSAMPAGAETLGSVAVEEARAGVTVRVTTSDGRHVERSVSATGPFVDVAIVEAIGSLFTEEPTRVVAVNDHVLDGSDVVLVLVESGDGSRSSGSAVISGGRPFAVGMAAWRAVRELG